MRQSKIVVTLTGGVILALATMSCMAKSSTRATDKSPSRDSMTASQRPATTELPIPTNRTGAGDNPNDSNRVVGCADQKNDSTGSPDCVPQNRRTAGDRTGNDRAGSGYGADAVAGCASRRDTAGNLVYDDPTCPARYSESQPLLITGPDAIRRIKDNAFFDRAIEKSVKHTREAEIAGDQGNAPEMLQHANLALAQAKQAQRAGNVPGLNEGIIELREALHVSLSLDRHRSGETQPASDRDRRTDGTIANNNKMTTDSSTRCTSRTDANGTVIYDDPACGSQYDRSRTSLQDATAHVREARVRLSEAGSMRPLDTRPPRTMGTDQKTRIGGQ